MKRITELTSNVWKRDETRRTEKGCYAKTRCVDLRCTMAMPITMWHERTNESYGALIP